MKIGITSVFVNDPLVAFTFYTQVLGFMSRLYMPEAKIAIVASPEDPDGTGLLLEPNDNPIAKSYQHGLYTSRIPAIVFTVPNLQEEYARLIQLGVIFSKAPRNTEWGIESEFDDTCGNYVQLIEMA